MTNLVTSSCGLGEKLILELLKRGESVYTIFPSPKNVPMTFLGKINLKYGFVQFDRDMNFDKALPKKVKYVFHVHETHRGSFTKLFKSNTSATLSLLEWARKAGVSKFIHLSSGEVYGGGENIDEKVRLNPRNFYATTKLETEMFFKFFHKSLNINIVRVFFPFGENTEGYIGDLHTSVKSGDSIDTEYQTISATFVNDLVEPLIKVRDRKENDTYNMCGEPTTVEEIVNTLTSLCGSPPKKTKFGKTELTGNSTKAKKELNFASTPLDEALKHTFSK